VNVCLRGAFCHDYVAARIARRLDYSSPAAGKSETESACNPEIGIRNERDAAGYQTAASFPFRKSSLYDIV